LNLVYGKDSFGMTKKRKPPLQVSVKDGASYSEGIFTSNIKIASLFRAE